MSRTAWSDLYNGLPGPRCLNPFMGWLNTWVYHIDLMEKAGLDPRKNVKTWDDLLTWLDEGAQWAKSANSGVDYFWDQGWLPDWFGTGITMDNIPLAFPDGQRDRQVACWKGEAKFNAPDSPYRHAFDFFKQAYDKGWVNKQFWTREWETDMEASYVSRKSAVVLHGPWIWDKAVAADTTVQQLGLPATPPAEGQAQWMQWMGDLEIDQSMSGFTMTMRACNETSPDFGLVKQLFIWWHSPDTVRLRAEAVGALPAMKLDPPADIKAPQVLGVIKDIGTPAGLFEQVQYETQMSGESLMSPMRIPGSPGVWDYEFGQRRQVLGRPDGGQDHGAGRPGHGPEELGSRATSWPEPPAPHSHAAALNDRAAAILDHPRNTKDGIRWSRPPDPASCSGAAHGRTSCC